MTYTRGLTTCILSVRHSLADSSRACSNKEKIKAPYHWPVVKVIHRWTVKFPHKRPIMRKVFPWHDVVMACVLPLNRCIRKWHVSHIGIWTTLTRYNSYPIQLVPKTNRTQDNLYPRQLVPGQLVPRTTCTPENSYLGQIYPDMFGNSYGPTHSHTHTHTSIFMSIYFDNRCFAFSAKTLVTPLRCRLELLYNFSAFNISLSSTIVEMQFVDKNRMFELLNVKSV